MMVISLKGRCLWYCYFYYCPEQEGLFVHGGVFFFPQLSLSLGWEERVGRESAVQPEWSSVGLEGPSLRAQSDLCLKD